MKLVITLPCDCACMYMRSDIYMLLVCMGLHIPIEILRILLQREDMMVAKGTLFMLSNEHV